MSDFYRELDRREREGRINRIFRDRPDNLHDYQGCKNDPTMSERKEVLEWIDRCAEEIFPDGETDFLIDRFRERVRRIIAKHAPSTQSIDAEIDRIKRGGRQRVLSVTEVDKYRELWDAWMRQSEDTSLSNFSAYLFGLLKSSRIASLEEENGKTSAQILGALGRFSDDPVTLEDALRCAREMVNQRDEWEDQATQRILELKKQVDDANEEIVRLNQQISDMGDSQ